MKSLEITIYDLRGLGARIVNFLPISVNAPERIGSRAYWLGKFSRRGH